MANEVTKFDPRLPMPKGMDIDEGKWKVLCESVFPMARTAEAIMLAVDYCKARKLDVMKKPVHIVPMWSSAKKAEVETVWPSITEVQITASRTGKYAGMDEPKWGPEITREFVGTKKGDMHDTKISVTFPEWCSITVYRMVDGERCAFTEPVYWIESYGRLGKIELPNDQWAKRPRGMIIKVAKAFSLRAAFPEEGEHVAEEMEGRTIEEFDVSGVSIEANKPLKKPSAFKNNQLRARFLDMTIALFNAAKNMEELKKVYTDNSITIDAMSESGHEYDETALEALRQHYDLCKDRLKKNTKITDITEEIMTPEEAEALRAKEEEKQTQDLGMPAFLTR